MKFKQANKRDSAVIKTQVACKATQGTCECESDQQRAMLTRKENKIIEAGKVA